MALRLKRRVALLLLALFAFAQGSVALAACSMERATLAQSMALDAGDPCAGCDSGPVPSSANVCLSHCTSDLQLAGLSAWMVQAPGGFAFVALAQPELRPAPRTGLDAPPPGAPPLRILLHSFLI